MESEPGTEVTGFLKFKVKRRKGKIKTLSFAFYLSPLAFEDPVTTVPGSDLIASNIARLERHLQETFPRYVLYSEELTVNFV
jgi:hypothetical protein